MVCGVCSVAAYVRVLHGDLSVHRARVLVARLLPRADQLSALCPDGGQLLRLPPLRSRLLQLLPPLHQLVQALPLLAVHVRLRPRAEVDPHDAVVQRRQRRLRVGGLDEVCEAEQLEREAVAVGVLERAAVRGVGADAEEELPDRSRQGEEAT